MSSKSKSKPEWRIVIYYTGSHYHYKPQFEEELEKTLGNSSGSGMDLIDYIRDIDWYVKSKCLAEYYKKQALKIAKKHRVKIKSEIEEVTW